MTGTEMLIEMWLIDRLIEYARNAWLIAQAAVDKVVASIKEYPKQRRPVRARIMSPRQLDRLEG
jgi:hypothetical protein